MALGIHPVAGTIVICDFDWFRPPEMVKRRPALVVSPRIRNRDNLCTVVPFSTTPPPRVMPYHYKLFTDPPLPEPFPEAHHWLKCDMIYTVTLDRLFMPFLGKDANGKRMYDTRVISDNELKEVRKCVLHGLGLEALTEHL
jgi:mRNA interferase MazF